MYLRTVCGETRRPSLSRSSLAMRRWPQVQLSRAICRISACSSPGFWAYSQNIRTRLPTGDYASTIICAWACLLLPSHPYSAPRGTAKPEGEMMDWKQLLAYITGTVDQELLLRNEYLVTENRILRNQIKGRARLTDAERKTLAENRYRLGK